MRVKNMVIAEAIHTWKMRVKKMVIAEAMGAQHSVAHILQEQRQDGRRMLTSDGDSDSGSERKTSVFVRSLRTALLMCSAIYGTANRVLDAAYACGIMNPTRLPVPVISVGNATWGGNGKTPMAIFLARLAHAQGLRPLVLTRGYGGDEDKLLCRRLAGVAGVGSGPNRAAIAAHMLSISSSTNCPTLPTRSRCMHLGDYKCGEVDGHGRHTSAEGVDGARGECSAQARRRYRYDLVILDDGHQHRKLVRDYNILMINCLDTSMVHWTSRDDADGGVQTRAELRGQLLPLGTLREPLEQGIAKAHLIVLHNCDLLSQAQLSALSHTVTNQWTNSLDRRSTSRAEKRQTVQMSDTAATPPQQQPPLILTYSQVSSIRPLLPFSEHAGGGEGLGAVGSVDWWLPGVSPGSRSMSPNTQKPRSAHCASHTRRAATQAPQVSTFVLLY
jgi:tetraacyldisaccharide-1-P 4'-kinase